MIPVMIRKAEATSPDKPVQSVIIIIDEELPKDPFREELEYIYRMDAKAIEQALRLSLPQATLRELLRRFMVMGQETRLFLLEDKNVKDKGTHPV